MSHWPKPEEWYVTPDGIIEFVLICFVAILLTLYVDKALDYHNLLVLRNDYDSSFCQMRAKVDKIQDYIGEPRS